MAHTTPSTRNLPNGGGSYQFPQDNGGSMFQGPQYTGITEPPVVEQPKPRSKYINPATGKYYTPQEYANSVAMKIPASKGTGDVTQYAGDALSNPDESVNALNTRATNLNNARNDIATGTTDPYKAGNKSGIAYSPQELAAIESAYAGVYDPALNDVFSRLKTREDEQKRLQDREDKIFSTNESIRAWRATTGTKSTSSSVKDLFTQPQLNDAASAAGLTVGPNGTFEQLDPDIINFYVNPPMGKNGQDKLVPVYENFEEDLRAIAEGDLEGDTLIEEIMASSLPEAVKHYFIDQIPGITVKEKEGYLKRLWGAIRGK